MPLNSATLAAAIKAKRLAALGGAVQDGPELDADCRAIAEAVVEHVTAFAVVTFPPGAIVVAGSATTQTNPAPVTGGSVG